MRTALEEFLRIMAEDEKLKLKEEIIRAPTHPILDVMADSQIIAANCYVNPSNGHALSAISSPWPIPLERLPLT